MALPLFGAPAGPRVRLSNADLERALADADMAPLPASASSELAAAEALAMKLLDVNVWLAAAWARHLTSRCREEICGWRGGRHGLLPGDPGFGFLRLVTNRTVTGEDAPTRRQAWDLLMSLQADPRIKFVPEPRGSAPLWIAFSKRDDRNHLLWTDDYLAAFAQAMGAELVTFDTAVRARYPSVDVIVHR